MRPPLRTTLTLRLDEKLIDIGKIWAKQHGKSLSRLVPDYLATLEDFHQQPEEHSPFTRGLLGLARRIGEEDYYRHLKKKYL